MLKSIKISNFYSFGEEQKISLEINSKDVLYDSAHCHKSGSYLNTVACIGSNVSGKTNALRALSFLAWFIEKAYLLRKADKSIPIELHKLHLGGATNFELEFYQNEILYRYNIKLNQKQILVDYLNKKAKRFNKKPIFKLIRNSKEAKLDHSIPHLNESIGSVLKNRVMYPYCLD